MESMKPFSALVLFLSLCSASAGAAPAAVPAQRVVLAGGCFWGMQLVFESLKGVDSTVAGYAGGSADTAQYETVSTGTTGHAESVEITYDPARISFKELARRLFPGRARSHRTGPSGPRHRLAIPFGDFLHLRAAAFASARIYRASAHRSHLFIEDRDDRGAATRLLSGRGIPSGFRGPQSAKSLHRRSTTFRSCASYVKNFRRSSGPTHRLRPRVARR